MIVGRTVIRDAEPPLRRITEERDGMLHSGMEQGMAQSYAALDRLLARMG